MASMLGRLPTVEEYLGYAKALEAESAEVYRYLSFDQMPKYQAAAKKAAHLPG